jgi:hypothetical protein
MITEIEFHNILRLPMIKQVASHARPFAKHEVRLPSIATNAPEDRSEKALAYWVAVQTRIFMKARGAASDPMIEKVWKFTDGDVDIDLRVGIHGGYHKFKVTAGMSGPTSFFLRIYSWNNGQKSCDFERYGAYVGNAEKQGVETLPAG